MEAEMKRLQDTAVLFEVSFPDYKQLHQCRSDIILVKAVWDMVIFVKVNIRSTKLIFAAFQLHKQTSYIRQMVSTLQVATRCEFHTMQIEEVSGCRGTTVYLRIID